MNIIKVFTDGSYKKNKLCGYGIYFPDKQLEDVSQPFELYPLTNQRAELYAILKSLELIEINKLNYDEIHIFSDSQYSINCLTIWYKNWEKNNWISSKKESVLNQDIIRPILEYIKNNKIKFFHINSHTNKKDFNSISNAIADELAKKGAFVKSNIY